MGQTHSLVVGGSGRLGGSIALELARRGRAVGVHYRSRRAEAERIAAACTERGVPARTFCADLSSRAAADELVAEFAHAFGFPPAELAVASGVVRDAPLMRTPEADWDATIRADLSGPAWILRAACARWSAPDGGSAVLVGSYAGVAGRAGAAAYAAAKAGLVGLARSVARELGGAAVRVNVVLPPFVPDGMGAGARPGFAGEAARSAVLEGPGCAGEFARFVVDVLELRSASGQVLSADSRIW